ncbi:MAG: BPL-N domain-containing protein [Alphaproteobacteria bacterium]
MTESSSSKTVVYIYNGPGVCSESVEHTAQTLKKILHTKYSIQNIGPKEVIQGLWVRDAALFVLPGGADLSYVKELSPYGNDLLKKYVFEGGAFLGICAGSYYSGKNVDFAKDTDLEVLGERKLIFFPDTVKGPLLKPYEYNSYSGACAASIHTPILNSLNFLKVYYNGGGYFVNAQEYSDVNVIADYDVSDNQKPAAAIVQINYGKGKVILSGVHWEYDPALLDGNDTYLKPIIADLSEYEQKRILLGKHLVHMLDLEV